VGVTDPLGNVTIGHRDYRFLTPYLVIDPNGNRQNFAFDALGMVVKMFWLSWSGTRPGLVEGAGARTAHEQEDTPSPHS
jgi:hypothetical protein